MTSQAVFQKTFDIERRFPTGVKLMTIGWDDCFNINPGYTVKVNALVIIATFSNEDENEERTGMTDWGLERERRPRRYFGGKQNHLANRLRCVDESHPTVKVTRENVFQRIS